MAEDRIDPRARAELIRAETASGAASGETATADSSTITISLSASSGYIALNWTNTGVIGKYDYVALYDDVPTSYDGYLTRQWQWVESENGIYVTGTAAGTGTSYWIAYAGWDYGSGEYVIEATAGPFQP